MQLLALYDQWAAAYAVVTGVPLVKAVLQDGWMTYYLDDSGGEASRALGEWRSGKAMVRAREFASAFKQVRRLARRYSPQDR